jgi:hypothetical protein
MYPLEKGNLATFNAVFCEVANNPSSPHHILFFHMCKVIPSTVEGCVSVVSYGIVCYRKTLEKCLVRGLMNKLVHLLS